jgi:hypothetical protein
MLQSLRKVTNSDIIKEVYNGVSDGTLKDTYIKAKERKDSITLSEVKMWMNLPGSSSDKEQILSNIYYDVSDGFDSLNATYTLAKKALPSITFDYVKQWLAKQKLRQGKPLRVFNSYVSPGHHYQYAVDIADFQKIADKDDKYKYLLVCIDTFTKYGYGVAMRSKDGVEITAAMREILKHMGNCKQIYSDDEGGMNTPVFKQLLAEHDIKHLITLAHASNAEKFIQRIKNMIMARIDGMDTDVSWVKLLPFIFNKYNDKTVHETIGMTPYNATLKRNEIEVLFNIANKASHARKYPPIQVGTLVRKYKKGDNVASKKGWISKWSDKVFEIERIENGLYFLKDNHVNKGILRHDLLRVDETQTIPDDVQQSNVEKNKSLEAIPTRRLNTKTRAHNVI